MFSGSLFFFGPGNAVKAVFFVALPEAGVKSFVLFVIAAEGPAFIDAGSPVYLVRVDPQPHQRRFCDSGVLLDVVILRFPCVGLQIVHGVIGILPALLLQRLFSSRKSDSRS